MENYYETVITIEQCICSTVEDSQTLTQLLRHSIYI